MHAGAGIANGVSDCDVLCLVGTSMRETDSRQQPNSNNNNQNNTKNTKQARICTMEKVLVMSVQMHWMRKMQILIFYLNLFHRKSFTSGANTR